MSEQLDILKEFDCDIDGSLARFLGDEEFMLECINSVLTDAEFEKLGKALAEGNVTGAFEAAHTLKGVTANTGLTPLYNIIVRIVEPLRAGRAEGLESEYKLLLETKNEIVLRMKIN